MNTRFRLLFPLVMGLAACSADEEELILLEPIAAEPMASQPAPVPPQPSQDQFRAGQGKARSGVVTAGDIDDGLNLAAFARYQGRMAKTLGLPRANLGRPVLAQLTGPLGAPAPGVRYTLRKPGSSEPFFDGYSGVDGMINVFPAALGAGRPSKVELRAFSKDGQIVSQVLATSGKRAKLAMPAKEDWSPDFLDLVFALDTTGSMGDEIAWLEKEIKSVVSQVKRSAPGVDIRLGFVSYKAPADVFAVKSYGFTKNVGQMRRWIGQQTADGGSGGPEVVARALETAVSMDWRRGTGERLLFLIGDEPPRPDRTKRFLTAANRAAENGIQVFGVGASGAEAHFEYLMRQASALTSGRYSFLTDDSGVGLAHGEPDVSCYRVTALKGLLQRVLQSEMTGRRVEAPAAQVVRTVGSYQNGRCLN